MKNKENIYIAREYMLTDDYGGIRIDEEAVLSSFEEAKSYLETLEDSETEGNDFLLFRTEIVEYPVGKIKSYLRKWIYNLKGELVDTLPPPHDTSETDAFKCTGKYGIGDIVYIAPKIKNKLSPCTKGTYGVIVEAPLVQENQLTTVEKEEELRREYTIYYITENGLLDHLHAVESALSMPKAGLPNEFKFLKLYSKHLKNEKKLPDSLIAQLLNEAIFIKNIKAFDFHNESIQDVLK